MIRKQIKNNLSQVAGAQLKNSYLVTFDNVMALSAFAEGIDTIHVNMPLVESFYEIDNVTHFLSSLSEIFGMIRIEQEHFTFYLQGDWPGKLPLNWCKGDVRFLTNINHYY